MGVAHLPLLAEVGEVAIVHWPHAHSTQVVDVYEADLTVHRCNHTHTRIIGQCQSRVPLAND